MARSSGTNRVGRRPAKLTKAEKKQQRVTRRQRRRETFSQMRQAFTMTRKADNRLVPLLVLTAVGVFAVVYVVGLLLSGNLWLPIIPGVLIAAVAAMFVFSRRAQASAYRQAEGQPGAAAYVLGQLRGDWHKTDAVAGTTQLDAVHRLLGRPGVVLIGEGAPQRVKPLLAQEKKRIARLIGNIPIYDVVIGNEQGQVPLRKLQSHLAKLPRNITAKQMDVVESRLAALGSRTAALPKGPLPPGAKMRSVQRAVRRR
jgi:hypothetical protein